MNELNRSCAKNVEASALTQEQMGVELQNGEFDEYKKFGESGILGFDIARYRDSITYYCMPHDEASEMEYNQHCTPPFPITDSFKDRIRLIMQTRPPTHLENHDLYELRAKGYDLIQAIKSGCEYWRDNAADESISSKAKYVADTIDQCGYEMGGAGNWPSVVDYVIDILEYAEKRLNVNGGLKEDSLCRDAIEAQDSSASVAPSSAMAGAISGYELVDKILNYYGNEGIVKLLECTGHQETEFLELKTSYLLSDEEKKKGVAQAALDWDIALAIIAIANTAGGALIIGIGDDKHAFHPVEVVGDNETFLRTKIYQRLLPEQKCWSDGKAGKWQANDLPMAEVRLCPYSNGEVYGNVVVILVEPKPKGRYIVLENTNAGTKLLVQRKLGIGKLGLCYDSAQFRAHDNDRRIERGRYLNLLRKSIPNLSASPVGRSSGVYRFKPVVGNGAIEIEDPLVRQTEGHRLCCKFQPGDKIDKYIVEERIGSGGMGVVYRVRHASLGKEYALKAFKMESESASMAKERFRAEAQVLKQLDHPGLPKVYDLGFDQESECLYLIQGLIVGEDGKPHELDGYTVNSKAAAGKGLVHISSETALKWLRQVCEIADYLHGKGIAHRDITLKNLLIDAAGNVKLTDFGVAKVMNPRLRQIIDSKVTVTVTRTPNGGGGFLGTLRYLPPEVRNKQKEDIKPEATDVWAIGVCFFKVLTGEWFEAQQFEDYGWNTGKWGVLLRGMLKSDSKERLSCSDVLGILAQEDVSKSGDKSVSTTRYDKMVVAFRKALVPNSEGILPIIAMLDSPLLNIESPTLGGKRWWDTLCEVEGWKLQKNKFFNQIRILDPQNFRRAWGWRRGMERMLCCGGQLSKRHCKLVWWIIGGLMSTALLVVVGYIIAT